MRPREYSAYLLCYDRQFDNVEIATKELNRIRAFCYRLKAKDYSEITFCMGVSNVDSEFVENMYYNKPKNQGGTKQARFVRVIRFDKEMGRYKHPYIKYVEPHIHIFIYGLGASSCADRILEYLKAKSSSLKKGRKLKYSDASTGVSYVERQSCVMRTI